MKQYLPFKLPAYEQQYLHIAMPAAMEGIFMILLSSVDIIMVSSLGLSAVAAVSIFTQPRMMLLTVARSIASALTLLSAQRYGAARPYEALDFTGKTLVLTAVVLGAAHIGFFLYLADILLWMGADPSYLSLALDYGNLALIGVFLTSLTAVLQAVLLGFGQTAVVMRTNIQGNVLNVFGNALFIFGLGPFPELGVTGAAVGTLIGTSWSLFATLAYMRHQSVLPRTFFPDAAYFRAFLPVFGGIFGEQGCERIGMVLYTRLVAELGVLPYAVHAICMNFCDFYYSFAGGMGKASMVLAGQARGASNARLWQDSLRAGLKWGLFFSVISCALTIGLREEIFTLYSSDAEALPLGSLIFLFVGIVSFPEAHALICAGALRGSGRTTEVAAYSFVSIAVLRPIITAFLLHDLALGLPGAWLALAIDQTLRAACASFLLWRERQRILSG